MKKVVVLGGGPAGAMAAARLAEAGMRTIILDEKLAWEKPCGGGLTYKAYSQYPFLVENDTPKKFVTHTVLRAPKSGGVKMTLTRPLVIYSRRDLNQLLLNRAERAGAEIEKTRVTAIDRTASGWSIRTRHGALDADYCILATGARNPLRNAGTEYTAPDTMAALGYYVPTTQEHIDIQFLHGLEGYIWVFPRCGHLSAGICGKGHSAHALRGRLEAYMAEKGISTRDATFYAHMLPALDTPSWKNNRTAGDGWLAAGDAAGLVDPITGEGLYYAIRSGDLASQVVLNQAHAPAQKSAAYRALLESEFTRDLAFASRIAHRVLGGQFLFGSVPDRLVQFMRRSPRVLDIVQDLFAGTQNYLDLKPRLKRNLSGALLEVSTNLCRGRMVASEA